MVLGAFLAATFSLFLTPWVIKFARWVGAIDQPGERKAHSVPMPRLGGVAVFLSFFLALAAVYLLDPKFIIGSWLLTSEGTLLGACLFLVMLLGFWDDLKSLKPSQKFGIQVLLASVVYLAGFRISGVTDAFGAGPLDVRTFDYPLTILWIVGVTNALNLIDGLDGLAAGVATIAALTVFPIALLWGDAGTALLAILLAGALVGFLRFNFNPAKIFLGDSGSLFIGFTLAVLSIRSSTKSTTAFALLIPILALGLPIMDTLLSMIRRFLRSFLPDQKKETSFGRRLKTIFSPDKSHIHHRLIAQGLSHRTAVLVLYAVSCLLGIGAFAVTIAGDTGTSLILAVVGIATIIGIRQLRYKEMAVLRNGILLPIYDWDVVKSDSFRVFLDVAFILGSYTTAHFLTDPRRLLSPITHELTITLSIVCGIQFVVFWGSGLYRGTVRHFAVGDVLGIAKRVTLSIGVSAAVLLLVRSNLHEFRLVTLILDYFFLLSALIISRFSFQMLNHLWRRELKGGKRVLIYGADADGMTLLTKILDWEFSNLSPAGFMDEDPSLEGKTVNGYQVFGGHRRLARIVKARSIDQILLANNRFSLEVLKRIVAVAKANGVAVRTFKMSLEDLNFVEEREPKLVAPDQALNLVERNT
jgi:UDP-GlcNAc:undecaprenyl-phosphate GlcNAc-1-phosphate transferase